MSRVQRLAVLGGTFDPIHRGHLEPVRQIAATFQWDRVLVMPAWRQPFKLVGSASSAFHRFAMAVLATEDDSRFNVSTLELERGTISYTSQTVEELRERMPETTIDWIIGDDNLADLEQWHRLGRILELANFVVLCRGGSADHLPADLAGRIADAGSRGRAGAIVFASNDVVEVSSTEIRVRVRAGEAISPMVGERVAQYIERNELYV